MKKLFCLSAVALTFAIQGTAFASRPRTTEISGDTLVNSFCSQYSSSSLTKEEVAEKIKLIISELNNPTLDQLSSLLEISEEMEDGRSLSRACR